MRLAIRNATAKNIQRRVFLLLRDSALPSRLGRRRMRHPTTTLGACRCVATQFWCLSTSSFGVFLERKCKTSSERDGDGDDRKRRRDRAPALGRRRGRQEERRARDLPRARDVTSVRARFMRRPTENSKGKNQQVGKLKSLATNINASQLERRRVRFVRARVSDQPLVDVGSLPNVISLNKPTTEGGMSNNERETGASSSSKGMSTRARDRGDDLYDLSDVRMHWSGPRRAGAGLANLGNTCFLNAVLQCLTHTPALANFALNGEHKAYKTAGGGFSALYEMGEHIVRALNSSGRTIAPVAFVKNLRALSKTFRKGRQEDAHELARCLLDALHKKCVDNVRPKISPNSERAETSFVWKVFGGKLRSQVNCKTCSRNSEVFDPFLDLSLECARAKSVYGAFKLFTHIEVLDGNNKYKCEGKSSNARPHMTKASKQFTVFSAPNVLALQLKRFAYVPFGRGKLNHFVEYPLELDITPYISDERPNSRNGAVYDLFGVLVHSGSSSNSGHYFAYVKTATGMWYEMDDDSVNPVSEKAVLKQKAYLLFYARRNAPGTYEEVVTHKKKISPELRNVPDPERVSNIKTLERKKSAPVEAPVPKSKKDKMESSPVESLPSTSPPRVSGVGKASGRLRTPGKRSRLTAFDAAKRALLRRRLKRLGLGVTIDDLTHLKAIAADSPVRTRNAASGKSDESVKDWLKTAGTITKWDGGEQEVKKQSSKEKSFSARTKRGRRDYDEFDEEYDRGKIAKHKRKKTSSAPALPKPGSSRSSHRKRNPFQRA